MSRIGVGTWITIATLALAGVVWAVRLEGRINANERELAAQDARHKESVEQVREDLKYIRGRLDQVLDGRRTAPTSGSSPAPAFHLTVRPRVAVAPADVEIRLQVEPGGLDRQVLLELLGPLYRSSLFPIRSNRDAPTVQPPAWYRSIPEGEYLVAAVLSDRRCDGCRSRVVLGRREARLEVRGR